MSESECGASEQMTSAWEGVAPGACAPQLASHNSMMLLKRVDCWLE